MSMFGLSDKKPADFNDFVYKNPKCPGAEVHIQTPADLTPIDKKRAEELVGRLAHDVLQSMPPAFSKIIKIEIKAPALQGDEPSQKETANEDDTSKWVESRCQMLMSKVLVQLCPEKHSPITRATNLPESVISAAKVSILEPEIEKIKKRAAHRLGDLFIGASGLEGHNQVDMMRDTLQLLANKRIALGKLTATPSTVKMIADLQTLEQQMLRGLAILEELANNADPSSADIGAAVQRMLKALGELQVGEGIILPGGWVGEPTGHAMYYEIIKDTDKTFRMRVYNAGAGLHYHQGIRVFEPEAPGFEPKLITKYLPYIDIEMITQAGMINPGFWRAAFEMISSKRATITKQEFFGKYVSTEPTNFKADDLYQTLFALLQGKVVDASDQPKEDYLRPQHSGTCSWAGLRALLNTRLDFSHFEHEIEMGALQELHRAFATPAKLADDEQARTLLQKSAQQLVRTAATRLSAKVINLEECNQTRALCEKIQTDLEAADKLVKSNLEKLAPVVNFSPQPMLYNAAPNLATTNINAKGADAAKQRLLSLWNPAWKPDLATIDKDLKNFHSMLSVEAEAEPEKAALCIKELFSKLPVPKREMDLFWFMPEPRQVESCMESIAKLSELLMNTCQKHNLSATGEKRAGYLLALYKGLAIQQKLGSCDANLQKMGIANWLIVNRDFFKNIDKATQVFDSRSLKEMHELKQYFFPDPETTLRQNFFQKSAYLNSNMKVSQFKKGNEAEAAYLYYLQHPKEFKKSLGPEFDKWAFDKKITDLELAKATYALTDMTGKFYPRTYCFLKRQFLCAAMLEDNLQAGDLKSDCRAGVKDGSVGIGFTRAPTPGHLPSRSNYSDKNAILQTYSAPETMRETLDVYYTTEDLLEMPCALSANQRRELLSLCQKPTREGGVVPYEMQVFKTLDYFKGRIDLLTEHDMQCYFRQMIFSEDKLTEALNNNPQLAYSFIDFIQKGYAHFDTKKNVTGAVFIVYVAQMLQERLETSALSTSRFASYALLKEGIDVKLHLSPKECLWNQLKNCANLTEKSIVTRQLLYLYAQEWPRLSDKEMEARLPALMPALSFLDTIPVPPEHMNTHVSMAIDRMRMVLLPQCLKKAANKPALLTAIAQATANAIGLEKMMNNPIQWKKVVWTVHNALCQGCIDGKLLCTYDLKNALLIIEGNRVSPLPAAIMNSAPFRENFPNFIQQLVRTPCQGVYEFKTAEGLGVRIQEAGPILQRQFVKNGPWYEYQTPINVQGLQHSAILQNERTFWKCCDSQEIVLTPKGTTEITHRIIASGIDNDTVAVIDAKERDLRLLPCWEKLQPPPYDVLTNFEPVSYTHVWVNKDTGEQKKIEMPRLSLTFDINPGKNTIDPAMGKEVQGKPRAMSAQLTGYWLAEKQHIPSLGSFKNYLVLKNDEGKIKVVIPRKMLLVSPRGGLRSDIALAADFPAGVSKLPPYFEYSLNTKGELEAAHEGGNLFLAYIKLGQSKYEEAQSYLGEKSRKMKRYTNRECEMLDWIGQLHAGIHDNDPKSSAVYLSAISLFWKNRSIHGGRLDAETCEKVKEAYHNYVSLFNVLGRLILPPKDELAIVKVLAEYSPKDRIIAERLALLNNTPAASLRHDPPEEMLNSTKVFGVHFRSTMAESVKNAILTREEWQTESSLITRPGSIFNKEFVANYRKAKAVKKEESEKIMSEFEAAGIFSTDKWPYVFLCAVASQPDKFPEVEQLQIAELPALCETAARLYMHYKDHKTCGESASLAVAQRNKEHDTKRRQEIAQRDAEAHAKDGAAIVPTFAGKKDTDIKTEASMPASLADVQQTVEKLLKQTIELANYTALPTNASRNQIEMNALHRAELLSGHKQLLTIDDLSVIFLRNDPQELLKRNPNLSAQDIQQLQEMHKAYLIKLTDAQAMCRKEKAQADLQSYISGKPASHDFKSDPILDELKSKVTKELSAKRAYAINDLKINPLPFLVFEASTGFGLRQDQVDNLTGLIKANHEIRQMIMGSGKSKILLPILALMLADGDHLPLIIVPAPLFDGAVRDLRQSVGGAFSRAVHTLAYKRDTEFTIKKLTDDFAYIQEIRQNRECLMMSSKSVACMALKYKEALTEYAGNPDDNMRQKLVLMQKILKLFKDKGKAIIDEADQILLAKVEINFTRGKAVSLEPERCQLAAMLFEHLNDAGVQKAVGGNPLESFSISAEHYHKSVKPVLLDKVLAAQSFVSILQALPDANQQQVKAYLSGSGSKDTEEYIKTLPSRNVLALLKEELNTILPLTLSKRFCVDYGPSCKIAKGAVSPRMLSIPYNGNNSPVETSEFRSPDVLMNYTLQTWWKKGIPAAEIQRCVKELQADDAKEKIQSGNAAKENTAAQRAFSKLCSDELKNISFLSCSPADCNLIAERLNKSKTTSPGEFFEYLATHVLSQIKVHPEQLTSNAIDLVGMFKTCIGFTGTPWNSDSYAEPLRKNTIASPELDAQAAKLLLEKTRGAPDGVRVLEQMPNDKLVGSLVRPVDDALIDTGAFFNGRGNEQVARDILGVLQKYKSSKKGVIFFQKNTPMVLEINDKGGTVIVPLHVSNLKPEERFTYYDQAHSTGTDIEQHQLAKATLTIGKDTLVRDVAQGAYRMRGLSKLQTISVAVSWDANACIRALPGVGKDIKLSFEHIHQMTSANQTEQKITHMIMSAKQKIENAVKQTIFERLLDVNFTARGGQEAIQLIKDVRHFLVVAQSLQPYDIYGEQDVLLPKLQVIKAMMDGVIAKLNKIPPESPLFQRNKTAFIGKIKAQMAELDDLVKLLPDLISSQAVAKKTEGQVETERETERELQVMALSDTYKDSQFNYERSAWWKTEEQEGPAPSPPDLLSLSTYTSNQVSSYYQKTTLDKYAPMMEDLLATRNRIPSDNGLQSSVQLPTQYVLYIRDIKTGKMRLMLLDAVSDLSFFWVALSKERDNHYPIKDKCEVELCISTLEGHVIQHDSSIDPNNRSHPFLKALQSKDGMLLRVRAKLALGEIFYTPEELPYLKELVQKYSKGLVATFFKDHILPQDPKKRQQFEDSPLYSILDLG